MDWVGDAAGLLASPGVHKGGEEPGPSEVGAAKTTGMNPATTEPRAWVRFPSDRRKTSRPVSPPDALRWSAQVLNISPRGIGLLVPHQFRPGEVLSVDLPGGNGHAAPTLLAYIVHLNPQDAGVWALGCTFARELADDELEAFGARRLKTETPDLRGWVRFPCGTTTFYSPRSGVASERWPAR